MADELIKTSIFYETIYAGRYVLKSGVYNWDLISAKGKPNLENLGVTIDSNSVVIERKEIFRCNIPLPLLERGEKFFIEEQSKLVKVVDRHRTSKDNVIYEVKGDIIEDEETIDTYKDSIKGFWKWYKDRYNFEDYLRMPDRYKRKNKYDEDIDYAELLKRQ